MLHIIYISLYNKISKRRNSPKITEKKLFIWFEKKRREKKREFMQTQMHKKNLNLEFYYIIMLFK